MDSFIPLLLIIIAWLLRGIIGGGSGGFRDDETLTTYKGRKNELALYEKKMLLTKAEYYFWLRLKEKCSAGDVIICPKVRMEDFVNIKTADYKMRQKYRGYIKSRHIDFILCDSKLNILAGVELDDGSHKQENVKKVDKLKDDVFEAINIPLFRVKVKGRNYDEDIDNILKELLGGKNEKVDGVIAG